MVRQIGSQKTLQQPRGFTACIAIAFEPASMRVRFDALYQTQTQSSKAVVIARCFSKPLLAGVRLSRLNEQNALV